MIFVGARVKSAIDTAVIMHSLDRDVGRAVDLATEELFEFIVTRMTDYPEPPENSQYKRTYKLKAGWEAAQRGARNDKGQWAKSTKTSALTLSPRGPDYIPLVQGAGQQKEIHAGRWQTEEEVAREAQRAFPAILEAKLLRVAYEAYTKK